MKKIAYFILFFTSLYSSFGQSRNSKAIEYSGLFDTYYYRGPVSFTFSGGPTAYYGDLCSNLKCKNVRPSFGIGAHYKLWPRVLFGTEIKLLKLKSEDRLPERNIGFKSSNFMFYGYGRFELLQRKVIRHSQRKLPPKLIKPYLHAGISYTNYSVESFDLDGGTISLPEEKKDYPLKMVTLPVGLGFRFSPSYRFTVSTQLSYHITFNDYLDEVSVERGSADKNDALAQLDIVLEWAPWGRRLKPKKISKKVKDKEETEDTPSNENSTDENENTPDDNKSKDDTEKEKEESELKDDSEIDDDVEEETQEEETEDVTDEFEEEPEEDNSDDGW